MNQTPNAPPPMQGGKNPYDFIHSPEQAKQPLGSKLSKQKRIMLVVGGVITLLILGSVVSAFISGLGDSVKQDILRTQQQQTEIIRISEIGLKQASSPAAKNLATTTNLTMVSDSAKLAELAQKAGVKADKKTLALGKDSKTDATLESARQNNQFDKKFTEIITILLTEYQTSLKKIYDAAENESTKQTLSSIYESASILIGKTESE